MGDGDCPGLNAVLRAVVKTAVSELGLEAVDIQDGFRGLLEAGRTLPLGLAEVRGLLPLGGTMLGTLNSANPLWWKEPGEIVARDGSLEILASAAALELDALVVVGGDGSLTIASVLAAQGLPVVGVPKSIDNDVGLTDLTVGFDSAVATATEDINRLHTTAESHHRIMVVEVMGHGVGWIAPAAGLAVGADTILLPEIPPSARRRGAQGGRAAARGQALQHSYRPFAGREFVRALPLSTWAIAVLDRTKEPGNARGPLYQDVVTAVSEVLADGAAPFAAFPRINGGRYGLASKEFTPDMARVVFAELGRGRATTSRWASWTT